MRKMIYALMALVMMFCGTGCSSKKKLSSNGKSIVTISGQMAGHDYVDLGLPSGTKWATCNVGATKPTESGDYFAWGETEPKKVYNWDTYKWCKGFNTTMTKYCDNSKYGTVDNKTVLEAEDDAATANWGSAWRMPTKEEQDELRKGCDWEWTEDFNGTGVAGRVGTSTANGNKIFLPTDNDFGYYWSSSLDEYYPYYAYNLDFCESDVAWDVYSRYDGQSVRAVLR